VVELFTLTVAQCCIFLFVDVKVFELSIHPPRVDRVTVKFVKSHWYRGCLERFAATHLVKTVPALTKLRNFFIHFFAYFLSVYA
jgi:hypothetical protein